jgi:hypothetical protein
MPTITILGTVFPPGVIIDTGPLGMTWIERGRSLLFEIEVRQSIVRVQCTIDEYDPAGDHSYYLSRALGVARAVVDPIAFREGVGLLVHLSSLIKPDETTMELVAGHPELHKLCTAFPEDDPFLFQEMLLGDPFLARAVNDLVYAISVAGHVPVNCGRALEALRRIMYPHPDPKKKLGWAWMQQELNFDQSYSEPISKHSTEIRHGNNFSMDEKIVEDVLLRTWTIFNRYFEYKNRGSQRLSDPDFPRLV